jgi:hypothetical protein
MLNDVVAPEILNAMRAAAEQLERAGIRHALAGALAVGAHGYPRASKDVEFLVAAEAFTFRGDGVVTLNPNVPIRVGNVTIDPIPVGSHEPYLTEALERAPVSDGIRILPIEALVYMKLDSRRGRDAVDVVELIKAGIDEPHATEYLARHTPALIEKFRALVLEAETE